MLKALPISCQDLRPGSFSVTGSARETQIPSVSWNNSFLVQYLDWLALSKRQPHSSAPAERTVSHRWVQPSKQDLETRRLRRTRGHRCKSESLPAGHVAHSRSQISVRAHGSWAESKQWFSFYCFSLKLLFTERIWRKPESGIREKQISCGRQDSSQLWPRKSYLSLFWSS